MADLDFPLKSFKEHCQMMNGLKPQNEKKEKEKEERNGKEERKERIGQRLRSHPRDREKAKKMNPCPRDASPIPS